MENRNMALSCSPGFHPTPQSSPTHLKTNAVACVTAYTNHLAAAEQISKIYINAK